MYTLIHIEFNDWNGFIFDILGYNGRSLLGINLNAGNFCFVDLFYTTFKLYDRTGMNL